MVTSLYKFEILYLIIFDDIDVKYMYSLFHVSNTNTITINIKTFNILKLRLASFIFQTFIFDSQTKQWNFEAKFYLFLLQIARHPLFSDMINIT